VSAKLHYRARVGALSRSRPDDDPDLVEARLNLRALNLEEAVRKAVAQAPELTVEQRDRIAAILRGGTAQDGVEKYPTEEKLFNAVEQFPAVT
jgi:hypothetical protein